MATPCLDAVDALNGLDPGIPASCAYGFAFLETNPSFSADRGFTKGAICNSTALHFHREINLTLSRLGAQTNWAPPAGFAWTDAMDVLCPASCSRCPPPPSPSLLLPSAAPPPPLPSPPPPSPPPVCGCPDCDQRLDAPINLPYESAYPKSVRLLGSTQQSPLAFFALVIECSPFCGFGFSICTSLGLCACGMWHVACGMWHVACGMWHVACGMWIR